MAAWRECPRAKRISDLQALTDLRKTHAPSIIRYQAQSEVEETVRLNMAFLVDLAALTPRAPAPLLAKAAKGHSPELSKPERASWANAKHCYKHKDVKKLAPATAAAARALQRRGREGAPTLPIDARSARGPALRSPPGASEIAAMRGRSDTPRAPTKKASVALGSPSWSTRKQSLADMPTPPAAGKPSPKRTSVREVGYNRMKPKETDDRGELREFDLAPGEKRTRAAILAEGATWKSEITNADFAAWNSPPASKEPAINKMSNKKPAAATGARRVEDEDLTMADEEGEGEAKPAAAGRKAKPAAAELPKAKPAAADPGEFAGEKGRALNCKTEQLDNAMHYKKSHSVGLRVKGGSQPISFGGVRCAASKEYLLEIGHPVRAKLNAGKVGLQGAKEYALSKQVFE
ncbi:unnamed protein product [Prorocentrum cordatum]|uniref:Uncharacterized protein n=1 Tax=Prorocentrum cordatum TaxID=2364126 RepID=A0ABN9W4W8_9DINO|nr:unnamed protein product [Polarella glacialis]